MRPDFSDHAERHAALDTSRSFHVEAPAGSGKTHLLTTRFLKLLGEVNHPQELLALTFTKKAAAEMKHRIHTTILRAHKNALPADNDDDQLMKLALRALKRHAQQLPLLFSPGYMNIMTFHSFCHTLAQRAPLESALPPDYRIMDDRDRPVLLQKTIRRLQQRILGLSRQDPLRQAFDNRLLRHANNLRRFEDELKGLILTRDRFQALLAEIGCQSLSNLPVLLEKRLRHYIESHLSLLRDSLLETPIGSCWESFIDDLHRHKSEAFRSLPRHLSETSWEFLASWQDMASRFLTKSGQPRKRLGPSDGFYEHFAQSRWMNLISGLRTEIADRLFRCKIFPVFREPVADLDPLVDFVLLSSALLSEYEDLCRAHRVVDFVGLEFAALRVVQDETPSDSILYLDQRIRHLLVDEFQDTSYHQWELLKGLLRGWEPADGRTVFLVGDPKQSIFGFRNADVSLFFRARAGIPVEGSGALFLENLSLRTNFRSDPLLIEWINGLFGQTIMADPREEADEVSFGFSTPSGYRPPALPSLSLCLFSHRDREVSKAHEARWLAAKLSEVFNQRERQASIAVLLLNRNRLRYYLKALNEAGLPVEVQEGLPLSERPEIRYLLQMTRLLARPHDDMAWVTLLRSPFLWTDFEMLHETALQEPEGWEEKIRAAASHHPSLLNMLRRMDRAFQRVGRDALGDVVRELWEKIDGPRATAALYGMAGVANCIRFFETLTSAEEDAPLQTLARTELLLDGIYEPPDPTLLMSKIQMMTVHRAKGLEFDVVFLPYLDWRPLSGGQRAPHPYLLERLPGLPGETLLAMGPDGHSSKPSFIYRILDAIAKERSWGEAKRLFYVAVTRAKDDLLMSGLLNSSDDSIRTAKRSALNWVIQHEGLSETPHDPGERKDSPLQVFVNPPYEIPVRRPSVMASNLPEPYPFEPEKLPYLKRYPAIPESYDFSGPVRPFPDRPLRDETYGRAIGAVTHRIIKTLMTGQSRPSLKAVSAALLTEGIPAPDLDRLVSEINRDVSAMLDDPFIKRFMNPRTTLLKSEWEMEGLIHGKGLWIGMLDLALFDGEFWWIVDFKTSRPSGNELLRDFLIRQENLYRPQLTAYRSMLGSLKNIEPETIHAGLYFTFLRHWHEIFFPPVTA